MPLQSKHFSGDKRLEACLVQDSAHVLRGDRGPYVLKIQQAVVILSDEAVPIEELDEMRYGPDTAKAVLSYKRQNSIINFAYQTTADDVVGKMTIKSLDEGMARFEAQLMLEPRPTPGPHPRSPEEKKPAGGNAIPILGAPLLHEVGLSIGDAGDEWDPPVLGWPDDLKATLARSNALRTRDNDYLAPIIDWGQGRKTLKELSKLLASSPDSVAKIREIYDRMKPFGIWPHIAAIRNTYTGAGSRGFFADAVDHDAFLRKMKQLTEHRNIFELNFGKARFCQDIGNLHGARDTFREVVVFGPGLHVCVTQPAERGKTPCDIHVDVFQQGNLVKCGHCIPLPDHATVAHVISVSPYLARRAYEPVNLAKENVKRYLKKMGADVPGL